MTDLALKITRGDTVMHSRIGQLGRDQGRASYQTCKQAHRKAFIKDFCTPASCKDVISC